MLALRNTVGRAITASAGAWGARRSITVEQMLSREFFDERLDVTEAWTSPAAWYTSKQLLALEVRGIFKKTWQLAARTDQLSQPGSFVSGTRVSLRAS